MFTKNVFTQSFIQLIKNIKLSAHCTTMLALRIVLHDSARINQQWNNGLTHAGFSFVCMFASVCAYACAFVCVCFCRKACQTSDVFMREWQERVQRRTNFLLRWWSSTENSGSVSLEANGPLWIIFLYRGARGVVFKSCFSVFFPTFPLFALKLP